MLKINALEAGYGATGSRVLNGVDFDVAPGEIVALLGRNGSGRSTLLRCLMGLLPLRGGSVSWRGRPLAGQPPHRVARLGIAYLPETRDIFPLLTVRQNLLLGQQRGRGNLTTADVFTLFPTLTPRIDVGAGALSGGEQQLLAFCRALMARPDLLLLDEPTEGLSPAMSRRVAGHLREERAQGRAVLLVEQKLSIALEVADRVLVLGHGRIVFEGSPASLQKNAEVLATWLQV
jgi:branched-chain amino acid transport system ATP-binding protein